MRPDAQDSSLSPASIAIAVVSVICMTVGAVLLGEDVKHKRTAQELAVEHCKISCHPAASEWLPITETCLCQVWSDPPREDCD